MHDRMMSLLQGVLLPGVFGYPCLEHRAAQSLLRFSQQPLAVTSGQHPQMQTYRPK